jgi:hypothetical protein
MPIDSNHDKPNNLRTISLILKRRKLYKKYLDKSYIYEQI